MSDRGQTGSEQTVQREPAASDPASRTPRPYRLVVVLAVSAAASIGFLWLPCELPTEATPALESDSQSPALSAPDTGSVRGTSVSWGTSGWCPPLGVPGEWTWSRIPLGPGGLPGLLLGWSLAALAFLFYAGACWLGVGRLKSCSRLETAGWLSTLVVAGFFWLSMLQESPPAGYRTSKAAHVLYYPGSSGYFFEARYRMTDVRTFLAGYEARMAEGDVLHVGTHPPGLFLFHRGLIALCDRFPAAGEWLIGTQPESVHTAFSMIAAAEPDSESPVRLPLRRRDRAALWMAALLTQAVGVLAVVPLFLLLRRTCSRQASWLGSSLWPLVPALAVFLPKSDALFPFVGLAFLYCWLEGCRLRSWALCAAAGLLFWLGMFLSLALLPVGLLGLLLAAWETRFGQDQSERDTASLSGRGGRWKQLGIAAAWAVGSFIAATAVLWAVYDVNLPAVWRWNVVNHAAFYDAYQRTYWKWLLAGPLELSFAVGLPIAVLAVVAAGRVVRQARRSPAGWREPGLGVFVCCGVTWGLLWLSGENSGEAARLWLFLMPWLIWLAAHCFEESRPQDNPQIPGTSKTPAISRNGGLAVIALQALVAVATVTRVWGFH